MKLTDIACKTAQPSDKSRKLSDGLGLYLEVMPNGSKYWRMKYYYMGKEKRLAFGVYPEVTLREAREKRDDARKHINENRDPALVKKQEKHSWNLKRFSDFEKKAGDVLLDIANAIRYVKPNFHDLNVSRWKNKEFWDDLLNALRNDLFELINNSKRGEIIATFKAIKIQEYKNLFLNLIPPYMAVTDRNIDDIFDVSQEIAELIQGHFLNDPDIFEQKFKNAQDKFIFLD